MNRLFSTLYGIITVFLCELDINVVNKRSHFQKQNRHRLFTNQLPRIFSYNLPRNVDIMYNTTGIVL